MKLRYSTEEKRARSLAVMSDYKKRNRAKLNEYARNKLANDQSFAISNRMRVRLNGVLYGKNKDFTTLKYFGCTVKQLFDHIESQFKPGMSWDNRSHKGWHIDHIVPICSFDLTNESQCKRCWHYTNLRPLWARENHSKNRYENNSKIKA